MTQTALAKAKKKLRQRLVYLTVMQVVVPETGELIGALVPMFPVDRRAMRENRFSIGKELRAVLRQARNSGFWRKVHIVGAWLAEHHVPEFDGLAQHDAVKKLQELSGIGCESVTYNLGHLGTITRSEAISLNFDDMDETEFQTLWDGGAAAAYAGGWIGWLREHVMPKLSEDMADDLEELIRKPEQGA